MLPDRMKGSVSGISVHIEFYITQLPTYLAPDSVLSG